jgi:hypothetical protein
VGASKASGRLAAVFEAAGLTLFVRGWLSSNNVLFRDPASGNNVLVDSGYWGHGALTVDLVRQALGGGRLQRVLNTCTPTTAAEIETCNWRSLARSMFLPEKSTRWIIGMTRR